MAISVDFDELPQNAATHLGLLCLIFHVEMLLGINGSTLIVAIFFCPENCQLFTSAAVTGYSDSFHATFVHGSKQYEPGSDCF